MRILALDIGGTSIKSAAYDEGILCRIKEQDTGARSGGAFVMKKVEEIIRSYGSCDAIGISTAGQVDVKNGQIRYANENIPEYTGMKVRDMMEETFHVPVVVENDVNAAALGEGYYGAAKNYGDYLCLTYGTGVGGAIVIGGQIFRGYAGSAGEVGSMVIHGGQTQKGSRIKGSYEETASTSALVRMAQIYDPTITSGRLLMEKLDDDKIQRVVDYWVQEVSYGLVSLIHIFNPPCVLIGGGIMAQESIVEKVRQETMERIMPSFRDLELKRAELGNAAGLWGAIYLAEKRLDLKGGLL